MLSIAQHPPSGTQRSFAPRMVTSFEVQPLPIPKGELLSRETLMPSLQDFSLISSFVRKYMDDYSIKDPSNAFYYLVLKAVLGLQDDEIEDSITDNHYLTSIGSTGGHDRGVDAVFIDSSGVKPIIHFFNCKYTDKFEKTTNNYPSGEIDKFIGFIGSLLSKDVHIKSTVNMPLYAKVEEIWAIFENVNPSFVIHLCTNHYKGLEKLEDERFKREIQMHANFEIRYHLMGDLVNLLTKKDKQKVNAKLRAIDKNFFEKSGGDIRALIADIDVRDLIRIVLDDGNMRNYSDIEDYTLIRGHGILEDAFEDNVRLYLQQRSKINRNIKGTALSVENHRFFTLIMGLP
jgi:hypothetical protein